MRKLDWLLMFAALAIAVGAVWWTTSAGLWPTQLRDDITDLETRVEILERP